METRSSIRNKLIRIIVAITAVVLLSSSVIILMVDYLLLRNETARGVRILAEAVAFNSSAAVAFEDAEDANHILEAFRAERNVRLAVIFDAQGEVFAQYRANGIELDRVPDIREGVPHFSKRTLYYLAAIREGEVRLGSLVLQYDLDALHGRLVFYLTIVLTGVIVALIAAYILAAILQTRISRPIASLEEIARRVSERRDYSLRAEKQTDDEVGTLTDAFNEMLDQIAKAETEIRDLNRNLERRVAERTAELRHALQELESFSYSVSHDLRAPLRSINGFSQALMEEHASNLDEEGRDFLRRILTACQRMGGLIEGLLSLSRVTRHELRRERINLSELAGEIAANLKVSNPDRRVEFLIDDDLRAEGDPNLLSIVMDNLIRNSWKFTSRKDVARIEVGKQENNGRAVFFVRDNGVGFDMNYVDKLFGVFQRLHPAGEFEGTGIGLATVRRIVERHGGKVWAEGKPGEGATFFFGPL